MASDLVFGLADLAHRLRLLGMSLAVQGETSAIEVAVGLGDKSPLYVRWLDGGRALDLLLSLDVMVSGDALVARAALAVARLNRMLPTPALVLDVESGSIDHRTRLFASDEGGIDLDLFGHVVATAVKDVERMVPLLEEWLRGEDADLEALELDRSSGAPWAGYRE